MLAKLIIKNMIIKKRPIGRVNAKKVNEWEIGSWCTCFKSRRSEECNVDVKPRAQEKVKGLGSTDRS